MSNKLSEDFEHAMYSIYDRALNEAGYKATTFKNMHLELGAVETARRLILSPKTPDGYTALWERGRLDLTLEALIYENEKWHELFAAEELAKCTKRLKQYGYLK
ncbi:hypothetical protein [Methylophilus sp. Leaf408]|uniref:hypothetical protein n=1 Tax=Methylophilus sp. Leaf408 TaxID=2876561 RepID=UPI001E42E69C|nr:hypothetical protein [Methylophilus sp. Leaf408]